MFINNDINFKDRVDWNTSGYFYLNYVVKYKYPDVFQSTLSLKLMSLFMNIPLSILYIEQHLTVSVFKIKVLSKHPDPMSRVIAEAMNIKNHTDKGLKNLNSKAEYHQAPIVRTTRQVTVGL